MTATLPTAGTTIAAAPPAAAHGAPPGPPGRRRARRLLAALARLVGVTVPVFLLATMITFGLGAVSGLSPAGQMLGDSATPADVARVNAQLGLDRPWVVRYVDWLGGVLHGDLGTSWLNGVPVSQQIAQRIDVSFSVAGFALVIGVVAGTALGLLAATHQGRWPDRAVTGFATLISTLPPFVVGIGLIVVLCVALPVFPSSGYVPFAEDPAAWIALITLPAVALSLDAVADIARQLRTGVVAAQRENYVTGALVRGLSPRRVLWSHVLRNGAGPALAVLGLRVPMLIGNAVVTESVFGLPGFGRFAADGAVRGDVPVVQGTLVVAIVVVLVFNLLVNVVLARLRPAAGRGA